MCVRARLYCATSSLSRFGLCPVERKETGQSCGGAYGVATWLWRLSAKNFPLFPPPPRIPPSPRIPPPELLQFASPLSVTSLGSVGLTGGAVT